MAGTLAERDAELAAIDAAIDAARGGAGSAVLIEGPAGSASQRSRAPPAHAPRLRFTGTVGR